MLLSASCNRTNTFGTWPSDSARALTYWWSMMTMRLSCTDTEIRGFKNFGVTSLTFWGHVTSSVTWPSDSAWAIPACRPNNGFGCWCFAVAGPASSWSLLSDSFRDPELSLDIFKRQQLLATCFLVKYWRQMYSIKRSGHILEYALYKLTLNLLTYSFTNATMSTWKQTPACHVTCGRWSSYRMRTHATFVGLNLVDDESTTELRRRYN